MKTVLYLSLVVMAVGGLSIRVHATTSAGGVVDQRFRVDTSQLETLPIGRTIKRALRQLLYVTTAIDPRKGWDLRIRPNLDRTSIVIERRGFWKVGEDRDINAPRLVSGILKTVRSEASWFALRELDDPRSASGIALQLRVIGVDVDPGTRNVIRGSERPQSLGFKDGDWFQFQVRNTGKKIAYITLLDLLADGGIKVLFPAIYLKTDARVPPDGEWHTIPAAKAFQILPPFGIETFKVIGTDRTMGIDHRYRLGSGGDQERTARRALAEWIVDLPGSLRRSPAPANWTATSLTFEVGSPRTLHVLSVGVKQYPDGSRVPQACGRDLAAAAAEYGRSSFDRMDIVSLTDGEATLDAIRRASQGIARTARPQDTLLFNFCGKAASVEVAGADAREVTSLLPADYRSAEALGSSLAIPTLNALISEIGIRNRVVIVDAAGSKARETGLIAGLKREHDLYGGLSLDNTVAIDGESTERVTAGLAGQADLDRDGTITARELASFVGSGGEQVSTWSAGEDFRLAETHGTNAGAVVSFIPATYVKTPSPTPTPTLIPPVAQNRGELTANFSDPVDEVTERRGKDYALLIGVNKYPKWPGKDLNNSIKDVIDIETELRDHYGFVIDPKLDVLQDPDSASLLRAMRRMIDRFGQKGDDPDNNQLFVYVAGHGAYDDSSNASYLLLHAAEKPSSEAETFLLDPPDYLQIQRLKNMLDALRCRHIYLVVDACESGSAQHVAAYLPAGLFTWWDAELGSPSPPQPYRTRLFLASADRNESAPDGPPGGNSPFAGAFLQILRGHADFDSDDLARNLKRAGLRPVPVPDRFGSDDSRGAFTFTADSGPANGVAALMNRR